MSYGNRQLFNRAVVSKLDRIEVMLAADTGKFDAVKSAVTSASGSVLYSDEPTGYLRIELPTAKLASLVATPSIVAYQIATNADLIWDQEGPPEWIATMRRGSEVNPLGGAAKPAKEKDERKNLPFLSVPESHQPGYTAEEDTHLGEWYAAHPSWDGRGVTVALMETGDPEFSHPAFRSAKTLDGKDTPKLAFADTIDAPSPDPSRIDMKAVIHPASAWYTFNNRTYILPHPGTFNIGVFSPPAGGNVREDFAILWDKSTGEIWVDTNGDASFADEKAMRDANEHLDVGYLSLNVPEKKKIAFIVTKGKAPDTLHLTPATGSHQSMTGSVAGGSRTEDGVASGVAPNARLMFVRHQAGKWSASDFVEGYIEIEKRPDVDVLTDSRGIETMPDMSAEFYSVIFRRIVSTYGKPIFHSGGNDLASMGMASGLDGVFSVGGSMGPATYAALYGGAPLDRLVKHPLSAEGPSGDGSLKPDFLAPMHRISASTCLSDDPVAVPKNSPLAQLPSCYGISCCTSASGPYGAGVAAVLISAARQKGETLSVEDIGRALRASATYLPESQAYAQGAGVLNVPAAWDELQKNIHTPRIQVSVPVLQPMASYGEHQDGRGLLETTGWAPGQSGDRVFHLRRESGAAGAITYRVSWTGNDGTFHAAPAVALPLSESVTLPVKVDVRSYGPHSAILNLHDPSGAIVLRTLASVVAPQPVVAANHKTLEFTGRVPLMRSRDHYFSIPEATDALKIELDITNGVLNSRITSYHPYEALPNRDANLSKNLRPGKYTWVLPHPPAGTWSFTLSNESGWSEKNLKFVSTDDATYKVSISALTGSIKVTDDGSRISVRAENLGGRLIEPVADIYPGTISTEPGTFLETGEPNLFEIEAPENAGVVQFQVKADSGASSLDLFLYDCTSGECFFVDYAGPAAADKTVSVHSPKKGKWLLAVNAAPVIAGHGSFTVQKIITTKATRQILTQDPKQSDGSVWTAAMEKPTNTLQGGTSILLCELVDATLERAEAERQTNTSVPPVVPPSDTEKKETKPAPKPVAIASEVHHLN
jgi:hypothetical protein